MLAFAIFGNLHLSRRDDHHDALDRYLLRHSPSGKQPSWQQIDSFHRFYKKRFLAGYELPEPFIQATDEALADMGHVLGERYKALIQMRYGLIDGRKRTLTEIADKVPNEATGRIGVTPERVRQMENRALRALRHPSRSRKIKASLTNDYLRQLFGFRLPEET
ncbi:MAG: hypothetical protein HY515_04075 [Candidatus Aenigmarchaeota archaeon]|nr:hypothetical protein [Candidatus Aenigmarchaeota archaeon]